MSLKELKKTCNVMFLNRVPFTFLMLVYVYQYVIKMHYVAGEMTNLFRYC